MRQPLVSLLMLLACVSAGAVPSEFLTTGDGSYYNPYRLSKGAHLAELDKEVRGGCDFAGKFLVLTSDIDMADVPQWMGEFTGIGAAGNDAFTSSSFCGDFNGRHYTVRNLNLTATEGAATGLFNSLDGGAYVHHLILDSSCAVSGGNNTGAVAGCVWNGTVEFCSSAAAVRGQLNVGGIVGTLRDGYIQNCVNTARVDARKGVGGIVGLMDGHTAVTGCYNTGIVAAATFGACAGIAGQAYGYASVQACYNAGLVSGRRSEEFDIDPSNILSDAPAVVWQGVMKGCCAVPELTCVAVEPGVTGFAAADFRSDKATDFLNDASADASYVTNPNSTAVITDRRYLFGDGRNNGFPVLGWELTSPGTAVAEVQADAGGVKIEGHMVRSLDGRPISVYGADGRHVAYGAEVSLPPGVYLVNYTKIFIR